MDLPLIVIDEASAFADTPEARELVNKLLLAGRKNGVHVQEQPEPEPETGPRAALRYLQYPTLAALEAAARRQ